MSSPRKRVEGYAEELKSSSSDSSDEATPAVIREDSSAPPVARRRGTGKWFLANASVADEFPDCARVDLAGFLSRHPNGSDARELWAIQLDDAAIARERRRIVMASFAWVGARGGAGGVIPANYAWFLAHVSSQNILGWMDFVATRVGKG